MKKIFPKNLIVLFGLALMFATFVSGRVAWGAERNCYEDWSAAAKHIERADLVPVKDIRKLADEKLKGELIKIKLCSEAERYVYQLVMVVPNGKVHKFAVDAKEPEF